MEVLLIPVMIGLIIIILLVAIRNFVLSRRVKSVSEKNIALIADRARLMGELLQFAGKVPIDRQRIQELKFGYVVEDRLGEMDHKYIHKRALEKFLNGIRHRVEQDMLMSNNFVNEGYGHKGYEWQLLIIKPTS